MRGFQLWDDFVGLLRPQGKLCIVGVQEQSATIAPTSLAASGQDRRDRHRVSAAHPADAGLRRPARHPARK
jgi:hypothetical protein